jgi:hypothetical protein
LERSRLQRLLEQVTAFADDRGYDTVETHLDIQGFDFAAVLETCGFRLVDSRIRFLTLIEKGRLTPFPAAVGRIHMAAPGDLDPILALTHDCLTHNSAFSSRFKNRDYFTPQETEAYFAAWIANHLHDEASLFAVLRDNDTLAGYYFYTRAGTHEGVPLYKGMLAAVAPQYRRHKAHIALQVFLFKRIPERCFYVDNTTQLTNFATVRNHIAAGRSLTSIALTFYRAGRANPAGGLR